MTPNTLQSGANLERESWELFEVGSYDEVISLAKQNPSNSLLVHLGVIALFESGSVDAKNLSGVAKGTSVFLPLVNAYIASNFKNSKLANEKLSEYFKSSNPPLCFSIVNFGVKLAMKEKDFHNVLFIISLYKKRKKENPFLEFEIESLYYLNSFQEVIEVFKENIPKLKDNRDVQMRVGLSLYSLNKFKEAETILKNIPGYTSLPTFEDKRNEYNELINQIPLLEKKKDLNKREISDLGFAYLFSENYQKAESIFMKLLAQMSVS
ncbi:MAG: tetratricopeptide repeat protein [Leptospiraceae bacterium]|nr:tetratricopeptide repeat protein [Leptospiraceae bacterium]MCK6382309.1 tetratricopeptide repeat protein [Leptospiraceae bacterium]NUM42295.1 tetratricopeptide repeat protein [Leptospiraceae bacterium]